MLAEIPGWTVTIQRQQARTNSLQLRLALFERRMKVFDATTALIATVLRHASVKLNQLYTFVFDTREHVLLFGPEIKEYLDDLHSKGVDLHAINAVEVHLRTPEEIRRATELVRWFTAQLDVTRDKFLKYI